MTNGAESYPFAIHEAQRYLRSGDKTTARFWAQQAANLAPEQEDPWLILAAVASPRASIEYLNHALEINPNSVRARKGMHWAIQRLRNESIVEQEITETPVVLPIIPPEAIVRKQFTLRPILLGVMIFLIGFAIWFAYPSLSSALQLKEPLAVAQLITKASATAIPTGQHVFAIIPTATASALVQPNQSSTGGQIAQAAPDNLIVNSDATILQLATVALPPAGSNSEASPAGDQPVQTEEPTSIPLPTATPEIALTDTPEMQPTATIGIPTATMEIVTATPAPAVEATKAPKKKSKNYTQPNGQGGLPAVGSNERWIDVDLSQQRLYAYEGNQIVNIFVVSTGLPGTPTVQGQYRIYVKYTAADMTGPGYYLPNVPYVMYFYKGYGLHGTYWHHNFGTPMSHGCVNLKTPEAQWLFNWASVGSLVNVHS